MKTGAELIAAERERQVSEEGWTPAHDDTHDNGELARAAAHYCFSSLWWPWNDFRVIAEPGSEDQRGKILREGPVTKLTDVYQWPEGWTFNPKGSIQDLVRAGALIAAEIDRLQRETHAGEE